MYCTTPEHEPHSLSRLKIGYKGKSSEKGYRLPASFPIICLSSKKMYTLRQNFLSDIVRLCNCKDYTHNFVGASLKKNNKRKENIMGLQEHKSP